jgi:hypothetical protein
MEAARVMMRMIVRVRVMSQTAERGMPRYRKPSQCIGGTLLARQDLRKRLAIGR